MKSFRTFTSKNHNYFGWNFTQNGVTSKNKNNPNQILDQVFDESDWKGENTYWWWASRCSQGLLTSAWGSGMVDNSSRSAAPVSSNLQSVLWKFDEMIPWQKDLKLGHSRRWRMPAQGFTLQEDVKFCIRVRQGAPVQRDQISFSTSNQESRIRSSK